MLNLSKALVLDAEAISASNLCNRFGEDDLKLIGVECWTGYDRDERSRRRWLERNEAGMDLALQIQKGKTFPWPDCANVAFPLVTIAAQQFHARAYPAVVDGTDVVKCAWFPPDDTGEKAAHAERVSTHMSWQRLYEDKCWEENEDKAILNLSIVGTNFKKSYRSSALRRNVSELVLAKNLVLDYWSKSVNESPRKTHLIPMFRNEVYEKVKRGKWRDVLEENWYKAPAALPTTTQRTNQDNRQGVSPSQPDETTSLMFGEQHVNLDLDCDGYAEPYIITFELTSKCVVRIVARFNDEKDIERTPSGEIIKITAMEYFTKKTFIPSPDGGIYDIGFGVFLGPLNEAVNSLVNMLLDCGTMQTTSGGFLGRGAKIRGGVYTFAPFEWKRVDSTGDDLRKNIVPNTVNQPSDVLFQLLSLLINYTSRVAGTTDITVGENPGQNTPAQTTQTMVEMGQKIYTAIFKRIWRSWKEEFEKLYKLNAMFLDADQTYVGGATKEDYLGSADSICPVADPNITSDQQRLQQAMMLKQAAMTTPGYDHDAVEMRFLRALRVDAPEQIFKGTQGTPPPKDVKLQVAELKEQGSGQRLQMELQAKQQEFIMNLMEERRVNNATIVKLEADAEQAAALAESEAKYAQVAAINAQISLAQMSNNHINEQLGHMLKAIEIQTRREIELKKLAQPAKKAA